MKLKSILFCASAMMFAGSSFGQWTYGHSIANTGGQKYVLLEEGTGTWCGYCPDGAQRIQETIEPANPRCISIAFHNGDGMALSPDVFNADFISGTTAVPPGPGWPGATIDRVAWDPGTHMTPLASGACGQNRGYWATQVAYQHSLSPNFDIRMVSTYDSSTRIVSIKVTGKVIVAQTAAAATAAKWRINAFIVEDSISSATYPQDSYMNTTSGSWFMGYGSPISPSTRYSHMAVVKKVLASGGSIYGDTVVKFQSALAIGDSASKTYTYTIPAGDPSKYTKVIGLVQKYGTATNDRAIENTIYARVRNMWKTLPIPPAAVIGVFSPMSNVELFPNPAQNEITVRCSFDNPSESKISICNSVGQVIYNSLYNANTTEIHESIPVGHLSNGTYFMSVTRNGEVVTKAFSVAK